MAKILKVNVSKTTIDMNDGSILKVDTNTLDFIPNQGDNVEVYKSENEIIVNKIKNTQETNANTNGKKVNKLAYFLFAFF